MKNKTLVIIMVALLALLVGFSVIYMANRKTPVPRNDVVIVD